MINYITAPFKWFFNLEAASGLVLLFAAIIALYLSNSFLSDYYFDILNIHFLIGTKTFGLDYYDPELSWHYHLFAGLFKNSIALS